MTIQSWGHYSLLRFTTISVPCESERDACPSHHVIRLVDLWPGPFAVFWSLLLGWPPTRNLCHPETFGVTACFCLSVAWPSWSLKRGEGGRQLSLHGEASLGNTIEGELRFRNLHGLRPTSPAVAPRRWGSILMSGSCGPCKVIPRSVTLARWGWTFAPSTFYRVLTIRRYSPRLRTPGCQNPECPLEVIYDWPSRANGRGDTIRGPWMSQGTRGFTIWFKEFEVASGLYQRESCFKDGAI
jgi:hypothetical protein